MTRTNNIVTKKRNLIRIFAVLDEWFDKEEVFQRYKPPGETARIRDLLEQVVLTSSELTNEIAGGSVSIKNTPSHRVDCPLDSISSCHFFNQAESVHEAVMTFKSLRQLRLEFRDNLDRSLYYLEQLDGGEDIFYDAEQRLKKSLHLHGVDLLELSLLQYAGQLNKIEEKYLIQPA